MTAAQTAALGPGAFFWQAYATKGSERVTLDQGRLDIDPNLAGAGVGFDGRSQAQKDLDAVQVAMRSLIEGGAVQRYSIGNRQIDKMPLADLIVLESRLKAQVARERKSSLMKNGQGNPDNLFIRFR